MDSAEEDVCTGMDIAFWNARSLAAETEHLHLVMRQCAEDIDCGDEFGALRMLNAALGRPKPSDSQADG